MIILEHVFIECRSMCSKIICCHYQLVLFLVEMEANFEFHSDPNVDENGVIHYLDLQALPDNGREVPTEKCSKFQILVLKEDIDESDHDVPDIVLLQLDVDKIVDQHEHETMQNSEIPEQVLSQLDVEKMVTESRLVCGKLLPMDNVNCTKSPVTDEVIKQKSSRR